MLIVCKVVGLKTSNKQFDYNATDAKNFYYNHFISIKKQPQLFKTFLFLSSSIKYLNHI